METRQKNAHVASKWMQFIYNSTDVDVQPSPDSSRTVTFRLFRIGQNALYGKRLHVHVVQCPLSIAIHCIQRNVISNWFHFIPCSVCVWWLRVRLQRHNLQCACARLSSFATFCKYLRVFWIVTCVNAIWVVSQNTQPKCKHSHSHTHTRSNCLPLLICRIIYFSIFIYLFVVCAFHIMRARKETQ